MPVTDKVRTLVFRRSHYCCEYCQIRDWWLEIDHIIPEARWEELGGGVGLHEPANLAAACIDCNNAKRDHVISVDELTGTFHFLDNPRSQSWFEHFSWTEDFLWLIGLTPIGRATVGRLKMNRCIYRQQRRLLRAGMEGGAATWP